jgi:hypothetical protein
MVFFVCYALIFLSKAFFYIRPTTTWRPLPMPPTGYPSGTLLLAERGEYDDHRHIVLIWKRTSYSTASLDDERVISCGETLNVDRYVPYTSALTSFFFTHAQSTKSDGKRLGRRPFRFQTYPGRPQTYPGDPRVQAQAQA